MFYIYNAENCQKLCLELVYNIHFYTGEYMGGYILVTSLIIFKIPNQGWEHLKSNSNYDSFLNIVSCGHCLSCG